MDGSEALSVDIVEESLKLTRFLNQIHHLVLNSDKEILECAIERYFLFLSLSHKLDDKALLPDQWVEVVWQSHILRTRSYRNFCLKKFGRVIDHSILPVPETPSMATKYHKTSVLWKKEYGKDFFDFPFYFNLPPNSSQREFLLKVVVKDAQWFPELQKHVGEHRFANSVISTRTKTIFISIFRF
jgi:hypothetical protein